MGRSNSGPLSSRTLSTWFDLLPSPTLWTECPSWWVAGGLGRGMTRWKAVGRWIPGSRWANMSLGISEGHGALDGDLVWGLGWKSGWEKELWHTSLQLSFLSRCTGYIHSLPGCYLWNPERKTEAKGRRCDRSALWWPRGDLTFGYS